MSDYLHGAYGQVQAVGTRVSAASQGAIVYVGTAPVNQVKGGAENVNKPIVARNIAEARKRLGYSDDWAKYTLCEPMNVHFEQKGVGPLVFINVLDPARHKGESVTGKLTFANTKGIIQNEEILLDSLKLKRPADKPARFGYFATAEEAKAAMKIFGKDAQSLEYTQIFYNAFESEQDKVTNYLFTVEKEGKTYACLDLGKNRAEHVTIFLFSLKDGNELTFVDGKPRESETLDLTGYTGDVTFSLYTCDAEDANTYPTNLKLVKSDVIHFESGAAPQYYKANEDYTASYSSAVGGVTVQAAASDIPATVEISYDTVDPAKVTEEDVIGASDGLGLNTGLYAVKSVYSATGYVPAYLAAPGWSSIQKVHDAMKANSAKINKHWDAYIFADMPLTDAEQKPVTLGGAAVWKEAHGYNAENETVYFPLARGTDGRIYHLSVLAAANFQELLLAQDGIPYRTASNTEWPIIENLYMGEDNAGRVYDDEIVNEYLNRNGISSAAFIGGRWVIWGAHSADYNQEIGNQINVAETNRMMLYYISNDFQARRSRDVDKPMTRNDLETIVSEEQTRIDALLKIGALIYGEVHLNADEDDMSDIMNGDYSFTFNVTTTPLAKSLTAIVNWTDDGFVTYFASDTDTTV